MARLSNNKKETKLNEKLNFRSRKNIIINGIWKEKTVFKISVFQSFKQKFARRRIWLLTKFWDWKNDGKIFLKRR